MSERIQVPKQAHHLHRLGDLGDVLRPVHAHLELLLSRHVARQHRGEVSDSGSGEHRWRVGEGLLRSSARLLGGSGRRHLLLAATTRYSPSNSRAKPSALLLLLPTATLTSTTDYSSNNNSGLQQGGLWFV